MADELYHDEKPMMFTTKPEKWGIYFNGENGEPVGRLEFTDHGELTFEGNATNAAEIFFDCVIQHNSDVIKQLREQVETTYTPVHISLTDDVKELMKSNEAKHYMKQIDAAGQSLQRFIMQNLKKE